MKKRRRGLSPRQEARIRGAPLEGLLGFDPLEPVHPAQLEPPDASALPDKAELERWIAASYANFPRRRGPRPESGWGIPLPPGWRRQ